MTSELKWTSQPFSQFTLHSLYEVLQLRQRVFVVEQASIYLDLDDLDQDSWHLLGRDHTGQLQAYARLMPPTIKYADAVGIGRVVIAPEFRGQGWAKPLLQQALEWAEQQFSGVPVRLSAQIDRQGLYAAFGFQCCSAPYDDGGIAHIEMVRERLGNA